MTVETSSSLVVIAQCGAPYGVRGWLHLHSFTDPKDNLLGYRPWFRRPERSEQWLPVEVVQVRPHRSAFVVQFAGVQDRDQAQLLSRQLVATSADQLPQPQDNEVYWRDLVGCQVYNQEGQLLGVVSHLLETGVHDVLVIRSDDDAQRLIPFVDTYVVDADVASQRITVRWSLDW